MRVTKTILRSSFILLLISLLITSCSGKDTPTAPTTSPAIVSLPAITTESLKLVYQDDFGNVSSGWIVYSSENKSYSYENGEYHMGAFKDISAWTWGSSIERTDFVVEADARDISVSGKSEYGIVFRLNENRDFYAFTISNGNYKVAKNQNEKWSDIKQWTKSSYIKRAGETNHLKVAALGETIEVYINGQKLYTVEDNSLGKGKIGLLVTGPDTSAAFDNFKVYNFTDTYLVRAGRSPMAVSNSTVVRTTPPALSVIQPTVPVVPTPPPTTPVTPAIAPVTASLPTITSAALKLVYQDNFGNVSSGWPIYSDANVSYSYKEGEYRISLFKDSFLWVTGPSGEIADFVVEVDARDLSSTGKSQYGINFRITDAGDYDFFLSGDSYQLVKRQNDYWSDIKLWTKSPYIKTGGVTNQLRIIALGNIIELYVNGQKLDTLKDDSLSIGDIALSIAGLNTSAAFDNFKIYSFTDDYLVKAGRKVASNGTINTGPSVVLAQQTVPVSGGTISISKQGDPLNGLQITVPSGAYKGTVNFTITSKPFTSNNPDYVMATPLISIENGGIFSNVPIAVRVPVKLAPDEFAMGFYIDPATGEMEGLPLTERDATSITIETSHFSSVGVAKLDGPSLHRLETRIIETGVSTNFTPEKDDWKLHNAGTFTSYIGTCAGMSLAAAYYFDEWANKNAKPRLFGQFLGEDPDIEQQAVMAWRLISTLQTQYINSPAYAISNTKSMNTSITGDTLVYNAFAFSILITHKPQLLAVRGIDPQTKQRVGHCMIVYAVKNGNLMVANPNAPGMVYRLPLTNGKLGPLLDPEGHEDTLAKWDTFIYLGKSAGVSWDKVGANWDAFFKGTVGSDVFRPAKLELVDEKGQILPLADKMTTDSKTVSIQVSNDSLNSVQISLFRDKQWVKLDSTGRPVTQSKITLDLRPGVNRLGLYVGAYTDSQNYPYQWYDFRWVTINCTAPQVQKWTGKLGGIGIYLGPGSASYTWKEIDYSFDFDVSISAEPPPSTPYGSSKGTASLTGTASVTNAIKANTKVVASVTGGTLTGGSNLQATVYSDGIMLSTPTGGPYLVFGQYNHNTWEGNGYLWSQSIYLTIEKRTDTQISGHWSFDSKASTSLPQATGTILPYKSDGYTFVLNLQP